MFEGLCLTLIPRYLEKVTEVAFHPTLRFHVSTLYFDYGILDGEFAEYEVWKAETTRAEVYVPSQDLDHSHANFCRLLASQKTLFDGRMDLAILSAALAMLPNLRTIEPIENTYPDADGPTPYDSIMGNENSRVPVLSDLQRDTLQPNPFVDALISTQPGPARPLVSLLSGLGLTRKQILTMEIYYLAWSFWEEDGPSLFQQQLIPAAFQRLEQLEVHFLVDIYDLEVRLQGLMPPSIASFIGAAPRLRLLNLNFQYYGGNINRAGFENTNRLGRKFSRAGRLFATLNLPNLAMFRLGCCMLTEGILIDFIRRHASTLKEIEMDTVVLDSRSADATSWEKTLKQIAPMSFLDLVELWWLLSDDFENIILAADPDFEARDSRHRSYCEGLTSFLHHRGQTDCPKILDFARAAG